jgi:curli production assembly/transport component CsgG
MTLPEPGRPALALCLLAALSACSTPQTAFEAAIEPPSAETMTRAGSALNSLPPPRRKVDVAVYAFPDQTGAQKPNDFVAEFSKAVTQGADAILIDVLKSTSASRWFTVLERGGLSNLVTERNLIEAMHRSYNGQATSPLPPMRFAGVLLEGGIVGFDSNVETGGRGAALLGIGASTQFRRDKVTVSLRAVSVNTGEVLASVMATKTVYSVLGQGSVFRYVATDEILELEAGVSRNEPVGLAVRQAIELAVYRLIVEGAEAGLWSFADQARQAEVIRRYRDAGRGVPDPAAAPHAAPPATPAPAAPGPQAGAVRATAEQRHAG